MSVQNLQSGACSRNTFSTKGTKVLKRAYNVI